MSEFIELVKVVIQNPSSSLVFIAIGGFLLFKIKDLLQIFLDIKDLNKKRLMQKFEETHTFHQRSFLSHDMNVNYERLCEEAQLKALIGCPYCSKEMAEYILSRKHITRAIRIYHRVKDYVEFENGVLRNKLSMPNWRIKINSIGGSIFYFLIAALGIVPFLFGFAHSIFGGSKGLEVDFYLSSVLIFGSLILIGFYILLVSMKPELSKLFCDLAERDNHLNETTDDKQCDEAA